MDAKQVEEKLIEVLRKIQTDGGYHDADIVGGETVPLNELEGFDSKLALVGIKRLSRALGVNIPKDKNIFREGGRSRGRKLSIREIAAVVANMAATKAEES